MGALADHCYSVDLSTNRRHFKGYRRAEKVANGSEKDSRIESPSCIGARIQDRSQQTRSIPSRAVSGDVADLQGFEAPVSQMTHLTTEAQLARIAAELAGNSGLTESERRLLKGPKPDARDLRVILGFINAGLDPLGETFEQIRSSEHRRQLGAVYTPAAIVQTMIDWAANKALPARIVDPGSGSGQIGRASCRERV